MTNLGTTGPPGAADDYEAFELLEPTGGQGYIFRARLASDRLGPGMTGLEVSLKQLTAGGIGVGRILDLHEYITTRTHPNLSRQLEVFIGPPVANEPEDDPTDDLTYVAASWVPGVTVDQAAEGRPLSRKLRWIGQIAGALDFLHADIHPNGPLLHRDIKPSNVIIDATDHAVLIDPGLARPLSAGATGTPHGSPGYQPPETRRSQATTPAADRWQLGALAYALIVGDPPGFDDPDRIRTRLEEALAPTHRPAALVEALCAMLDADPGSRPAPAFDWAVNLETIEAQTRRPPPRRRRQLLAVRIGALAAIVGAGCIGYALHPAAAHARPPRRPGGTLPLDSRLTAPAPAASHNVTVDDGETPSAGTGSDIPAYLSTRPVQGCRVQGCAVPGTEMTAGTMLTATCQQVGETVTSGDASSEVWYGIRLPDNQFGYLPVVRLAPQDRDGLDLGPC